MGRGGYVNGIAEERKYTGKMLVELWFSTGSRGIIANKGEEVRKYV